MRYEIPKVYVRVDMIPRTQNGKGDKRMSIEEIKEKLIALCCEIFKNSGFDIDLIEYADFIDDLVFHQVRNYKTTG